MHLIKVLDLIDTHSLSFVLLNATILLFQVSPHHKTLLGSRLQAT